MGRLFLLIGLMISIFCRGQDFGISKDRGLTSLPDSVIGTNKLAVAIDTLIGDNHLTAALDAAIDTLIGDNQFAAYMDTIPGDNEVSIEIGDSLADRFGSGQQLSDVAFMLVDSNIYRGATTWNAFHEQPINDELLKTQKKDGGTILALPINGATSFGAKAFTDGSAYYTKFYVKDTITVTGIKYVSKVQGDFTADNYNELAIYSVSGTTYTMIARTRNSGDIWKLAANAVGTEAFVDGPYILNPGFYYVAALYNSSSASTGPQVYVSTNYQAGNISTLLGGNNKLAGTVSSQTELPASEVNGDLSTESNALLLMLY